MLICRYAIRYAISFRLLFFFRYAEMPLFRRAPMMIIADAYADADDDADTRAMSTMRAARKAHVCRYARCARAMRAASLREVMLACDADDARDEAARARGTL